jgi:hypothetical protein
VVLYAVGWAAFLRVRKKAPLNMQFFMIGLPLAGILSMPASYLLLEGLKWSLVPQIQPMRALLFVTVAAQFGAAAAGVMAGQAGRFMEALAWFALALLAPVNTSVTTIPTGRGALVIALLAAAMTLAAWAEGRKFRWSPAAACAAAMAAFFLVPGVGHVSTHPRLHTPELAQLSRWARASTPVDAVFLFPDAGKRLEPGIFRSEALRALYVDWKGGGQVNYLAGLGEQWWQRFRQVTAAPFSPADVPRYQALGINYLVLSPRNRLADRTPAFENGAYVVYAIS